VTSETEDIWNFFKPNASALFHFKLGLVRDISVRTLIRHSLHILAHLFVKFSQPGDSEETFLSSSQATTCYY